jgi:hypothetical protein
MSAPSAFAYDFRNIHLIGVLAGVDDAAEKTRRGILNISTSRFREQC